MIGGALTGTAPAGISAVATRMVVEADESDGSFLQYPARSRW